MASGGSAELRRLLDIARRRWLVVVLLVCVSTGSAFVLSERMPKTYKATAEVQVEPVATDSTNSSIYNLFIDPTTTLQNDADLIQSDAVLKVEAQNIGLSSDAPLQGAIGVAAPDGSLILHISASTGSPAEAAAWANGAAQAFIDYQRQTAADTVQTQISNDNQQIAKLNQEITAAKAAGDPTGQVPSLTSSISSLQNTIQGLPGPAQLSTGGGAIISPATAPTAPSGPRVKLNVLLGAIVGLLLAAGIVFLAESLDERLRSADEVEESTGAPGLGFVPLAKRLGGPSQPLAVIREPTSGVAEAYRTIRTNLQFLSADKAIRSLLVTSAVPGEGKSTTAANLAAVFALAGTRTVLISGDLRKPSAHQFFRLATSPGLGEALLPDARLDLLLQRNELTDFRLLAAGRLPPNPTEILSSQRFAEVLSILIEGSDLVIIDSPPVLGLADASMLASKVDGVLMVIRPGTVKRRALVQAIRQLEKAGGRILGTVLNAVTSDDGYGYHYRDMGAYYDSEREPRDARVRRAAQPSPRQRTEGGHGEETVGAVRAQSNGHPSVVDWGETQIASVSPPVAPDGDEFPRPSVPANGTPHANGMNGGQPTGDPLRAPTEPRYTAPLTDK